MTPRRRTPGAGRIILALTLSLMSAVLGAGITGVPSRAAGTTTEVIVHYSRPAGDYTDWNLWMWPSKPTSGAGAAYTFTGQDAFGKVADVQIPGTLTEVGIIARRGEWAEKDGSVDRFIEITGTPTEVWLIQGDKTIYTDAASASKALDFAKRPSLKNAYLDGSNLVYAYYSKPIPITDGASGFVLHDQTAGQDIPITSVDRGDPINAVVAGTIQKALGAPDDWLPADQTTVMHEVNSDLYQFTATLKPGTYLYKIALNGGWAQSYPNANVSVIVPAPGGPVTFSYIPSTNSVYDTVNNPNASLPSGHPTVQTNLMKLTLAVTPNVNHVLTLSHGDFVITITPRLVLDSNQYMYQGHALGATYSAKSTSFRLWAPTASHVQLSIFKNGKNSIGGVIKTLAMKASTGGTWTGTIKGNLKNKYYYYAVTNPGHDPQTAVDPYARNVSPNGQYGVIVDLKSTNPKGWKTDTYVKVAHPEDAVIWEVHVRDFSIDPDSGMKHKGQFLAFTETNTHGPGGVTTGVAHLKEMGVTHVEILPSFGFASVDELHPNASYNWGYDPRNYNSPSAAYATTPWGNARITQFKQMVQALHKQHIGVIMDVVYPHTATTVSSDFDKIVPQYFYRTNYAGDYTDGSGVGNEIAAERPMVAKFIEDSVAYWMKEYHVDGFRFDQMALLGKSTVDSISQELHAINPSTILLGEPWGGGTSSLPASDQFTKGQQQGSHVAVFNDDIRDGTIGNAGSASAQGYATGDPSSLANIVRGLTAETSYSTDIHGFTANPDETINYVTCHDNYTLWDKISQSNSSVDAATLQKMDTLAQTVVLTAQGIPYIQGGEEFLRTKQNNGNSYNAGDAINQLDWSRKSQYAAVVQYYEGLIHLRLAHPAFRMSTAADIKQHLRFLAAPNNVVSYELTDHANGDSWSNIVVIFNPGNGPETVSLPTGSWTVVGDGTHVGEASLGTATGSVSVPAYTAEILYGGDLGTAVDPLAATGVTGRTVNVTFHVKVPSNTPASDTVFIAGNTDALGPWDPAKQPMQPEGNNTWGITLHLPDKFKLEYKYVRGDWSKVENWGTITGLVNRHVSIDYGTDGTQVINDTSTDWGQVGADDHRAVQKWADLPLPTP